MIFGLNLRWRCILELGIWVQVFESYIWESISSPTHLEFEPAATLLFFWQNSLSLIWCYIYGHIGIKSNGNTQESSSLSQNLEEWSSSDNIELLKAQRYSLCFALCDFQSALLRFQLARFIDPIVVCAWSPARASRLRRCPMEIDTQSDFTR